MIKLYEYQEECVESIFDYFLKNKNGNPVCALPTGTGKSVCIAEFIIRCFKICSKQKILVLTHVKKLIEQNSSTLLEMWPEAPIGFHSAGLTSKDFIQPIIFGGIQTVCNSVKKGNFFGFVDLIIVDECHLINTKDGTNYAEVISELRLVNSNLKIIGFSATPYRLGHGLITENSNIFTDFCFDRTKKDDFNYFIRQGYLCPLVPIHVNNLIECGDIPLVNGEFDQSIVNKRVNVKNINSLIASEIVSIASERKKWLIFCSSIDHVENVTMELVRLGVKAKSVHSKKNESDNDAAIEDLRSGAIIAIVNNNKLTTGINIRDVDFIAELMPTTSPAKMIQIRGRGMRTFPGKIDCGIADFAGNTARLGPINDPIIPKPKKKSGGEAPIKICPQCGYYNHASAAFCSGCAIIFERKNKLTKKASELEIIAGLGPPKEQKLHDVIKVVYSLHTKIGSNNSMCVRYITSDIIVSEWVCFEHDGFAGNHAKRWWAERSTEPHPKTSQEAVALSSGLKAPIKISAKKSDNFYKVTKYVFLQS